MKYTGYDISKASSYLAPCSFVSCLNQESSVPISFYITLLSSWWFLISSFLDDTFLFLAKRKFLDNIQDSYLYLKWSLNDLLTKTMNSYSCLAKWPEITSLYLLKQGQLYPTSVELTVIRRCGKIYVLKALCNIFSDYILSTMWLALW